VLAPLAFIAANEIIYSTSWSGRDGQPASRFQRVTKEVSDFFRDGPEQDVVNQPTISGRR
jgi:hypothetical protein